MIADKHDPIRTNIILPRIYARTYRPGTPHFIGASGHYWPYSSIEAYIRQARTDLFGLTALQQLDALGLRDEFDGGSTPHQIPATFADKPGYVR